jgi:hypothetical protein
MHVALQHKAIPELIKLFPRVQFIVSTHSPLVALGMQKTFGEDGVIIVDMPSGMKIDAEQFAEFEHALRVLQDTRAFQKNISALAKMTGKMLVLLEGETDPLYMKTAAEVLEITPVREHVDFEWVGAKDQMGQGFHTGKDALNQTLTVLRANPDFIKRQIVLLYDNDAKKNEQNLGELYVRSMSTNSQNSVVQAGIENLLLSSSITDDMFETKTKVQKNATKTVVTALKKMDYARPSVSGETVSNSRGFVVCLRCCSLCCPKIKS